MGIKWKIKKRIITNKEKYNIIPEYFKKYYEENFEKLFKKLGESDEKAKNDSDKMHEIYSPKKERQYGVIGIKVKVIE